MFRGPLNGKIGGRFIWPRNFWPNACVIWLQGFIRQAGPVFSNSSVETIASMWIDCVIDIADPFGIRAEPGLAREIEGKVDTKSSFIG